MESVALTLWVSAPTVNMSSLTRAVFKFLFLGPVTHTPSTHTHTHTIWVVMKFGKKLQLIEKSLRVL